MLDEKKWVLWKNEEMSLQAAFNPAISRKEGFHLVLLQKKGVPSPWADPELYSRMQLVAAQASAVIVEKGMASWVNIHYDGNIGAAEGKPNLHIHIFGRYKRGKRWGGPLALPRGKGPYHHKPISQDDIEFLRNALKIRL